MESVGSVETAQPLTNRIPTWLGLLMLLIWLAATAAAFWFLQLQYLRPFSSEQLTVTSRFFEGQKLDHRVLTSEAGAAKGVVIHFWDPDCPCTRFSSPHVADLIQQAEAQGLASVVVARAVKGKHEASVKAAKKAFGSEVVVVPWSVALASKLSVPASPAALVVSGEGDLRYVGPYSSDAFCSTEEGAFVEQAISHLASEAQASSITNNLALACFCSW